MLQRIKFLLAVLLAMFLLAGCSGQEQGEQSKEQSKEKTAPPETTVETSAKERTSVETTATTEPTAKATQSAPPSSASKGTAEKAVPTASAEATVTVTRVVDGDTIEISPAIDGIEDVRLIGVDTPETKKPNCQVQPYGPEASSFTTAELQGQAVGLEFDQERADRYDRLLAYVYSPDGSLFNETLVEEGYARVATFPPNTRYVERFQAAEASAKAVGLGIWSLPPNDLASLLAGECTPSQPAPPPPPAPQQPAPKAIVPEPVPDVPSAPGVAPGADCSLGINNIPVIPGGKGDRDKDGIACES